MRTRVFVNPSHSPGPGIRCASSARMDVESPRCSRHSYLNEIDRHWRGEQPAIPVMLRLADCAHTSFDAERTFASAIAKYFEIQAGAKIDPFYLLNCFDQQQFLFLLSGDEDLGDAVLQQATNTFRAFRNARRSPDPHQYVIILDQSTIKVGDVPDASTCLIIQPMSVERVTHIPAEFPSEDRVRQLGSRLLERLSEGLWDLAEVPWLLREMLDQADAECSVDARGYPPPRRRRTNRADHRSRGHACSRRRCADAAGLEIYSGV